MRTYSKLFLLTALITVTFSSNAQEYDDMYFSKKDRKKVKPVTKNEALDAPGKTSSFLSRQIAQNNELTEEYSENEVSQEAIDKYRKQEISNENESEEILENSNYSNPNETYEDEYYEEEPVIVNNYYYDDPWRYNNGWRGYRNPWRYRSGFSVSFGWGFGWGAFGGGWGYDPFWDPYYAGFNNPWYGGYNSWHGGFNSFYGPPYYRNAYARGYGRYDRYGGYYGAPTIGRASARRAVTKAPRNSRGGAVSSSGRSTNVRNVSEASSTKDNRDYSSTQAAYLDKSRRGARISGSNGRTSTATRSANRSAADGINRNNSTRYNSTGRSSSGNVRSSSSSRNSSGSVRSSNSGRSSSGSVRSGSSSRGGSKTVRPSSSSRSRSSGVRSSSSSRSSSVRSSSPSRSSGSVRSSGSSRSSSGRSSSGRSSSGRSSSSRSRGN